MKTLLFLLAFLTCLQPCSAATDTDGGIFMVDIGSDIAFGTFTYEDATVEISEEFFNPNIGLEYAFPGRQYAAGIRYAESDNAFDLDYDNGKKTLLGSMDCERSLILPYVRIGPRDGISFRIGASFFEYEFSNAELDETRDGTLTKKIREGEASGDLSLGVDAEVSLLFGTTIQGGVILGGAYYPNAQYDWQYRDDLDNGRIKTGTAELDAASGRLGFECAAVISEGWRLYARFMVSATSWLGSKDEEDEDYAGIDGMSSVLVGLRIDFGM